MIKMDIDADTPITLAVELKPQAFQLFKQIGMCCINETNENWTVEELCKHHGADIEAVLEYING